MGFVESSRDLYICLGLGRAIKGRGEECMSLMMHRYNEGGARPLCNCSA